MSMDAAWKVYVGDRRFDDNQISNLFLKLKYETVGRFTFDFRPIDGDESYMVPNNTLRIFWGDLHKLDGVIQRVDWDDSQYCYHVFGADIRGFLLDRVNTEPSTVSSYTSDIQTQVQYTGCDFPSNIWTGAGDKIGTYTFHYKLGIQNTIRITGATQNIWHNVIERGTVYEHQNGCLYDATKNWEVNKYAGATLRFVSGACKNAVYNVNGNTANRVCIRLPGEPATMYGGSVDTDCQTMTIGGVQCGQIITDPGFERTTSLPDWYDVYPNFPTREWLYSDDYGNNMVSISATSYTGAQSIYSAETGLWTGIHQYLDGWPTRTYANESHSVYISFWARSSVYSSDVGIGLISPGAVEFTTSYSFQITRSSAYGTGQLNTWAEFATLVVRSKPTAPTMKFWMNIPHGVNVDDVKVYVEGFACPFDLTGTIPGCSRLGDIYEIVTASMERIEPASLTPATLEKDNHIVNYNQTEDLSDRTTVVTVMGAD